MDKQQSAILNAYGKSTVMNLDGQNQLVFARMTEKDVNELSQLTDEQLIERWKTFYLHTANPEGCFSVSDFQEFDLICYELKKRESVNKDLLNEWVKTTVI